MSIDELSFQADNPIIIYSMKLHNKLPFPLSLPFENVRQSGVRF